jgi:hypothetical protein
MKLRFLIVRPARPELRLRELRVDSDDIPPSVYLQIGATQPASDNSAFRQLRVDLAPGAVPRLKPGKTGEARHDSPQIGPPVFGFPFQNGNAAADPRLVLPPSSPRTGCRPVPLCRSTR